MINEGSHPRVLKFVEHLVYLVFIPCSVVYFALCEYVFNGKYDSTYRTWCRMFLTRKVNKSS